MTGRPRGDRSARQRALQDRVQDAAGMLPLDVVDPTPADPVPDCCPACGRGLVGYDGRGKCPNPYCDGVDLPSSEGPEQDTPPPGMYRYPAHNCCGLPATGPHADQCTSASPADCQACGSVLDDGQSFLCGACAVVDPAEAEPLVWDRTELAEVYDCRDCNSTVPGQHIEGCGLGLEQGPQFVPWRTVLGPAEPIRVTLPGVYELDATEYHDPAVTGDWLSNSDARAMTLPGCPAQWRYDRDNGIRKTSEAFAVGHAVHAAILGKGEAIAVRPAEFDSWRTKKSQVWRAEYEAAGMSVILPEQAEFVVAMAAAVHGKPRAHELLSQPGRPEVALFWVDPETGVRRRALVDYLPDSAGPDGVMEPVDVKSADSVAPDESMSRKLYDHGWHRQATTIADGIVVLGLARVVEFSFIVQSKTAPHLVTVVELDSEAERIGKIENRNAMLIYQRCLASGVWPDYGDDPVLLGVPPWIAKQYEDEIGDL